MVSTQLSVHIFAATDEASRKLGKLHFRRIVLMDTVHSIIAKGSEHRHDEESQRMTLL